MQTRHVIARFAVVASLTLAAIAAPSTALADPTASHITEPADPSFVAYVGANPGTLHVAGTTSGGSGNVDLRCYGAGNNSLIATGVPVVNGAFAVDLPVDKTLISKVGYPHPYCVLRAVPTGTQPAAQPDQSSPFEGPHVGWGEQRESTLGLAGAPNPPDTTYFAYTAQTQAQGYSDFQDAGSCGLCDGYLLDPLTYKPSNPLWWGNAALYQHISYGGESSRSEVQVDGVNVYDPGALSGGSVLKNNPGYPSLTVSRTVDALTGDLTIHETDPFVPCEPQPAALPISDATCPSFGAPPIALDRTIIQDHQGRQVHVIDHWHSNDAQPHQLDAIYDDVAYDQNAATAGHESQLDFPWTCDGFKDYPAGTDIAPPPATPATLYVRADGSTPDVGDGKNPFGALTYATPPDGIHIQMAVVPGSSGLVTWLSHYVRTIPANGDLSIEQVYSIGLDLASVQALGHEAEQASPPQGTAPSACSPPSGDASIATTAPAAAVPVPATFAASAATAPQSVKCRVPKLRGRTLTRAKRMLRHAHCRLGRVTRKPAVGVRDGRVLRSTPPAGTARPAGARISVRVASASR